MKVLVAGGAGYIGSHCVRQLISAGHEPVVLDNLAYGHRSAVPAGVKFIDANLGDVAALGRIFAADKYEIVMHFAAFCYVGELVKTPIKYYLNNCSATYTLLDAMMRHGVRKFVFSSTCATFGEPAKLPLTEDMPQAPIIISNSATISRI
ncbi:MAG TPA: NAD-dependent epimerase/dehydratase family protein, partial [Lacunisphaera sp.]|nr:NAD-dependent epimerase/dehydratase family protein [Lacunisphaera sp.]